MRFGLGLRFGLGMRVGLGLEQRREHLVHPLPVRDGRVLLGPDEEHRAHERLERRLREEVVALALVAVFGISSSTDFLPASAFFNSMAT